MYSNSHNICSSESWSLGFLVIEKQIDIFYYDVRKCIFVNNNMILLEDQNKS